MDLVEEQLRNSQTIAVVGLSDNPERFSYRVAKYLQEQGYKIIPVNPMLDEVLGEKSTLLEPFRLSRYEEGKLHPVSNSPFPWS